MTIATHLSQPKIKI